MDKFHDFLNKENTVFSLKRLNYFMLISSLLISALLFFAMYETETIYNETHTLTWKIIDSEKGAYNLQIASDYLTEQIRLFAANGDKKNLDNYFTEATVTKRRDKALELLKSSLGEDSPAYEELRKAMNDSVNLMRLEYHAARLIADAYHLNLEEFPEEVKAVQLTPEEEALSSHEKEELAEDLLFGEDYRNQKRHISNHMTASMKHIENKLSEQQSASALQLKKHLVLEHLLTVLLIGILLTIVFLISHMVISPLRSWVEKIQMEKEIPPQGTKELRFLAKTYNKMRKVNLRNREKLNFEATHDKLTNAFNRRGFDRLLNTIDMSHAAVLLIDLDNFKNINDSYGHDVGDRTLKKVTAAMEENFKDEGLICRIGGDEFAVIMENTSSATTGRLKKKIRLINEKLKDGAEEVPPFSISVGVSFWDEDIDIKTLLRQADVCLYRAKEHGKSALCFHDEEEIFAL